MQACRFVTGRQRQFKHRSDLQRAVVKVAATLVPALACSTALAQILPTQPIQVSGIPAATFNIAATYGNGAYVYGGPVGANNDWSSDINATVAACNTAGGGTVVVPSGTYLSSPFTINAPNFNFQVNGTLQCEPESVTGGFSYFVDFANGKNSEITGSGTIDGNGSTFWSSGQTNPVLVHLSNAQTFLVQGVTLQNSARENITVAGSKTANLTFNGVTITNSSGQPNTDGIDPNGNNVLIENCNISTGDDDIAVKAPSSSDVSNGCNNITIVNCTFGYGHGVSVGGQTNYGVNNMFVNNCTFTGTVYGLRLKAGKGNGGIVQNVSYSNCTMTDVDYPIVINSWYNGSDNYGSTEKSASPYLHGLVAPTDPLVKVDETNNVAYYPFFDNVSYNNISTVADGDGGYGGGNAVVIYGLNSFANAPTASLQPPRNIDTISFSNVNLSDKWGADIYFASNLNISGLNVNASNGNAEYLYNNTYVPEPASAAMLLLAPALILRRRRRSFD